MFILLDKIKDISSFRFINKYASENNIKKIGHTGTLDPMATGLLLVATNDSTKIIEYLKNEDKKYVVEMKFGQSTDTQDATGNILEENKNLVTLEQFIDALRYFEKKYYQVPPIFSAKKINGQRAYKLARKKSKITLKPQLVSIFKNELISFNFPIVKFKTHVSKGTYIRSLVVDLAKHCNSLAYMTMLDRIAIGNLDRSFLNKKINIQSIINLEIQNVSLEDLKLIKYGKNLDNFNKKSTLVFYKEFPICISENHKLKKVFAKTIERIFENESN